MNDEEKRQIELLRAAQELLNDTTYADEDYTPGYRLVPSEYIDALRAAVKAIHDEAVRVIEADMEGKR